MTCKHACQKLNCCSKVARKLPSGGPEIPPKNQQKSKPGTPRSPFLCSQVPLNRSMVPQGAKMDATSMPNDTFWAPKLITSAPKITVDCKTRDSATAYKHQRTNRNFSRETKKRIQPTTGRSNRGRRHGRSLQISIC